MKIFSVANDPNASQKVANYEELADSVFDDSGSSANHHAYGDAVAAYLAEGESQESRKKHDWVYVPQLGLSIEKIKDGYTMESLWEVVET